MNRIAKDYQLSIEGVGAKDLLKDLVLKLSKNGKVALLIDEYDKPITDNINELQKGNENREVLREFYGVLKGIGDKFSIIFITGIAKFAKVSLFSVLNHLNDLSLKEEFAALTGITHQELLDYYEAYLDKIAIDLAISQEELLGEIKKMYNGYSWDGKTRVYNPFSLINFLNEGRFRNYWINTGTPKFLVDLIRAQRIQIDKMEVEEYEDYFFESFDLARGVIPIMLLLFQTGYLTIQNIRYQKRREIYQLGYPNEEVERAFTQKN